MEAGKVLVVDDDEDIRDVIALILEGHGLEVAGAADGLEALQKLRSPPLPAVILLDLMMPRLSGGELLRVMHREPRLAQIPVVVLSGDVNVSRTASQLGAAGYLAKPVDLESLLGTVMRFVAAGERPQA